MAGSTMLCQEHEELSCSSEDRQYSSSSVYQQDGRHTVERSLPVSTWDMEQVHIDCHITISVEHLPGSRNQIADRESMSMSDSSEWALDSHTFYQSMDYLTVDLFAARLSVKLPTYYSWRLDPGATAVNALCQPWGEVNRLCFPTFLHDR